MNSEQQDKLEQALKLHFDAGDYSAVATSALRGYGPQLFGLLVALHHDEVEASDVFAEFSENLWCGLPRFQWNCSFRTWAYTLLRNASFQYKRKARQLAVRQVPLSVVTELSGIAAEIRSSTSPHFRTDIRDGFVQLRQSLPKEEQLLLILRVDKKLAWDDIVRVMHGGEPESADVAKREAARLRKRFQLLKERIVEEARRKGLLPMPAKD